MDPNSTLPPMNQTDLSSIFTKQVLPPLYCIIFVVGLSLNIATAWILFRVPGDSGLVVYLKNMVVADLFMMSTFPFRVAAYLGFDGSHLIFCRYTSVFFYFSMYVGILFICFISLERYVKVVHHTASSTSSSCCFRLVGMSRMHVMKNPTFARVLASFTWSLLLLINLPNIVLASLPADQITTWTCIKLRSQQGMMWYKASSVISASLFLVTLLIVVFCYTSISLHMYKSNRRVHRDNSDVRRKSNRSIFRILAVFFICFVPYHACRIPYTLSQMREAGLSSECRFLLFQIKVVTDFLLALNVCFNPIIYFLMCRTFRESLLRKLSGRQRRRSLTTTQTSTNIQTERTEEAGHKEAGQRRQDTKRQDRGGRTQGDRTEEAGHRGGRTEEAGNKEAGQRRQDTRRQGRGGRTQGDTTEETRAVETGHKEKGQRTQGVRTEERGTLEIGGKEKGQRRQEVRTEERGTLETGDKEKGQRRQGVRTEERGTIETGGKEKGQRRQGVRTEERGTIETGGKEKGQRRQGVRTEEEGGKKKG